jgi:glycosyltransferase involved in cell wall biosynthesis
MIGWPPLYNLWHEMKEFDPDIVIVRNYTVTSAIALFFGNILGASGLLQEQVPKHTENPSSKKSLIDKVYKSVWGDPLVRLTPIEGDTRKPLDSPHIYYVPFVVDIDMYNGLGKEDYFRDDKINLISVGKFSSPRKNHIGLLTAFKKLYKSYDLHLTLVGSLKSSDNKNYQKILRYIREYDLGEDITIKVNMDYKNLQSEYSKHDLFVLPSRDEPAAISPLEAMAAGLPVICSDTNGTKGYISKGENGFTFLTESQYDLEDTIETAIENKDKLKQMGKDATEIVQKNHHPDQYCSKLEEILRKEFDLQFP